MPQAISWRKVGAALTEGDSQPEYADNVVTVLPFSDPKLEPGSDVLFEPVGETAPAVDDGPGLLGEEAPDAEQDERVHATDLVASSEVVAHLCADMAKGSRACNTHPERPDTSAPAVTRFQKKTSSPATAARQTGPSLRHTAAGQRRSHDRSTCKGRRRLIQRERGFEAPRDQSTRAHTAVGSSGISFLVFLREVTTVGKFEADRPGCGYL